MTQEEWLRDVEAQFFGVITKSDGLQELTDYAYTLLQNPIMVSNERGEFLAKPAQNRPYGDALWEEFDLKGYIPREKRSKMSTVYFKSQMRNDRIVILDKHYISHRLMVYQTELAGRFLLRGLLLESKRPFTKLDEQVFERFVRVAAYHVQDSEMVRNFRRDTFEYFSLSSSTTGLTAPPTRRKLPATWTWRRGGSSPSWPPRWWRAVRYPSVWQRPGRAWRRFFPTASP